MSRLHKLTYCSVAIAAAMFMGVGRTPSTRIVANIANVPADTGKHPAPATPRIPITPQEHVRAADQTFLTYPEWFLVYGPAEQAEFFGKQTATKFPFMTHVEQIWGSYAAVYDQVKGRYPFNSEYHTMIMVIATSSTIEFSLKAAYETMIGRLTDTADDERMTAEDVFNARFSTDYVEFLGAAPWYEYSFTAKLKQLWTQIPLIGRNPLRKLERRYYLTTELIAKSAYGWLIGLGTRSAYAAPILKTAVVVDQLPAEILAALPDIEILRLSEDGSPVVLLPRYAAFKPNLQKLAARGIAFKEIAGNNTDILITLITPRSWSSSSELFGVIFTQPLPTRADRQRVAVVTPIASLDKALRHLSNQPITIEHIYDF